MGFVDELKRSVGMKKRNLEDDETDVHELGEAQISLEQSDPRKKTGIRQSNMTDSEKKKLRLYRSTK